MSIMSAGVHAVRMGGDVAFVIGPVARLAEFVVGQTVDVESESICGSGFTDIDQADDPG